MKKIFLGVHERVLSKTFQNIITPNLWIICICKNQHSHRQQFNRMLSLMILHVTNSTSTGTRGSYNIPSGGVSACGRESESRPQQKRSTICAVSMIYSSTRKLFTNLSFINLMTLCLSQQASLRLKPTHVFYPHHSCVDSFRNGIITPWVSFNDFDLPDCLCASWAYWGWFIMKNCTNGSTFT